MDCDHDWGPWGLPKPDDEGVVLSYRRCQRCNLLEQRTAEESFETDWRYRQRAQPVADAMKLAQEEIKRFQPQSARGSRTRNS